MYIYVYLRLLICLQFALKDLKDKNVVIEICWFNFWYFLPICICIFMMKKKVLIGLISQHCYLGNKKTNEMYFC